ncbi:unnamed protein product [Durusdinium trenchii]|uniref:DNA topoisomerase n=1 Tax=Durusdinium trenchii TaxID=1381693 RepID=A0ABP0KNR8_9DINO
MAWGLKKKDPKAYFSYLAQHPEVYAKQQEDRDRWREGLPQVLMVAEKPSVARLVAECLCGEGRGDRVRERRGLAAACPVLEFVAVFPPTGQRSVITMTSVIGHIFQLEFDGQLSNDLVEVYSAPVVKVFTESARKVRVGEHLKDLAKDSSQLCLWLDADDREGENIGFEVIALCKEFFDETKIHRAIFSALTKDEVSASFQALGRPNADIAMGVDTRQELDLRVGIAFSRLLTRHLRNTPLARRGKGLKPSITYGPCQTPALGFCVQRQDEIDAFRPKKIWRPTLELDPAEAQALRRALTDANSAELQLAVKEDGRVMGGRGRSCAMDSAKLASISAPFGPRLRDLSEALHSPSWSIALGDRTLLSAEALDIQGDEVVARLFRFVPGQGFVDSGDDYISKLRLPRLGDRPINLFTGAHFTCVGLVVNCTKDMLEFSEGVALGIRPEFVPDMAWSFLHQFAGAFSGWKQAVQWLGKSGTNFVLGQQVSVDAATEVLAQVLRRWLLLRVHRNQFPEYTTAAGAASDMDTSPQHKSSPSQPAAAAPSEKQDPLWLQDPWSKKPAKVSQARWEDLILQSPIPFQGTDGSPMTQTDRLQVSQARAGVILTTKQHASELCKAADKLDLALLLPTVDGSKPANIYQSVEGPYEITAEDPTSKTAYKRLALVLVAKGKVSYKLPAPKLKLQTAAIAELVLEFDSRLLPKAEFEKLKEHPLQSFRQQIMTLHPILENALTFYGLRTSRHPGAAKQDQQLQRMLKAPYSARTSLLETSGQTALLTRDFIEHTKEPLPNPVTPVLLIHRLNPLRLTGTRFVALPANCNGDMRKEMLPRPLGLNTVQLLRAASNALNLGPKQAMKVAEDHVKEMAFQDLYSSGLISYPRTETTRYHETFDARPSLRPLTMLKLVGAAQALKTWTAQSHQQSYRARDVGDHPPIVPLRTPEPGEVSGQQKRLYDYVCQHFVASWLADVKLQRYEATVEIEGFQFQLLLRLFGASSGWLQAMPWRIREWRACKALSRCVCTSVTKSFVHLKGFQLAESWTEPPKPLTEAELVELMDQNGIGTDASIPQHIQTIQDRAYVQLHDGDGQPILPHFGPQRGKAPPKRAPGRYLVPSRRGLALVKGLSALDASLCEPEVRALIERECAMVATAEMKQEERDEDRSDGT